VPNQSIALRRILTAQIPADFADWLDFIALITLMTYVWQVEEIYFAWLAVAMALPYLFIGPLAGALTDRLPLRRVMVLANVGRAIATVPLALAGSVDALLMFVFIRGAIDSFFSPAKQATFQALAAPDALMQVNSQSFVINQLSKIVGPGLGGVLMIWLAPQTVILANVGLSSLAALILMTLPNIIRAETPAEDKPSLLAAMRNGFGVIIARPALWMTFLLAGSGFFALFLYDALIGPTLAFMGYDAQILGASIAAVGAGGVIGALLVGKLSSWLNPFTIIGVAMLIAGPMIGGLGLLVYFNFAPASPVLIAGFAVAGIFGAGIFVPQRTLIQIAAPPNHIGLVSALFEAATIAAMLGAPFIGAFLASRYGFSAPYLLGGALLLTFSVLGLLARKPAKPSFSPENSAEAT